MIRYQAKLVPAKPVRSDSPAASKQREEQDYYLQKIQELVLNKKRKFAREEVVGSANKFPFLSTDDEGKKKKKIVREPVVWNYITEELTQFIKDEMNGTDTKLVIQKILSYSDIKEDQDGFNMPFEQLETRDFLTIEEKKDLEEDKKKIVVRLVGPTLEVYEQPMVLSKCHMSSTNNYVLKTNWSNFVKDNKDDLKEDSKIHVWSFRRDQQLYFALVVVERAYIYDENELIEDIYAHVFYSKILNFLLMYLV